MSDDRLAAAPRSALSRSALSPSAPWRSALQPEPNVTPMIDVLLVLLIIFMFLVAMNQPRRIDLQLPDPRAERPSGGAPSIVLEVLPGGGYAVNHAPVAHEALGSYLRTLYAGRPDKILFVQGDPRVRYQDVFEAMDVARGAGVRVIGIPPKR